MYPLPEDPTTDPLIRARAWALKALRERPDNAHHVIASVLLGLDPIQAIQLVRELAEGDHWADDLAEVMGEGWAEDILGSPQFAPQVRALEEREADARAVAGLDPARVAEHLLWEWAARRGLIEDIPSVEWERRHAGTDGGEEWIADHERVARVLDGDFTGALVVEGLAEAFVRAVRRAE